MKIVKVLGSVIVGAAAGFGTYKLLDKFLPCCDCCEGPVEPIADAADVVE